MAPNANECHASIMMSNHIIGIELNNLFKTSKSFFISS